MYKSIKGEQIRPKETAHSTQEGQNQPTELKQLREFNHIPHKVKSPRAHLRGNSFTRAPRSGLSEEYVRPTIGRVRPIIRQTPLGRKPMMGN